MSICKDAYLNLVTNDTQCIILGLLQGLLLILMACSESNSAIIKISNILIRFEPGCGEVEN